ncbi:MAG: hypothetical protein U0414_18305 [Polyangiaceae bacterium]
MRNPLVAYAFVVATFSVLGGCGDTATTATATATGSAQPTAKSSVATKSSTAPAASATATATATGSAAASAAISVETLKKFKPAVPKGMEADYEWAENKNFMIEGTANHPTEVRWDLVSKKDAKKVALSLDIEDQTADVKSGNVTPKDDKYKTYSAKKGADFIRVDIKNVQVQVEIKDKAAATMDSLTKALDALDDAGLAKL